MEVFKIIFLYFLIALVFAAPGCQSQHWSHGWLPGGKRNALNMDAYVEMIHNDDVLGENEIPRFQYFYEKVNNPQTFIPDNNDRSLQRKMKAPIKLSGKY
ncbi:progonadoliberin-1-like [Hemitrygon akajei]|uniref:progonadoliberin-1-like n=1 Tax=Hemitrygon akajei TaxID=2704970 RepID=UPI003BF9F98A